jgi:2'-5' RNA ligase
MAETLACVLLPPDAAAEIVALQRQLASYRPLLPPHLTLLPPVHGRLEVGRLAARLERVAARSPALALTVGPPATFLPAEPVVYFQVGGDGLPRLHGWRRELAEELPQAVGALPFVPHVTLVRGLAHEVLLDCLAATRDAVWDISIETVHLISMTERDGAWSWETRAQIPLSG